MTTGCKTKDVITQLMITGISLEVNTDGTLSTSLPLLQPRLHTHITGDAATLIHFAL
jgi:hypothetical protein